MPLGFDRVRIYNMALSHVGSKSNVESVGESSRAAKICDLWYDAARLYTLEAHNWQFARKSAALATHPEPAPDKRWMFRYQYPADCVMARYLENPGGWDADVVPFEVEEGDDDSKSIVTDLDEAVLIYTRNILDVTRFSMHYTLMLSLRLAMFINPELTGKQSRYDRMAREWNVAMLQVPEIDGHESAPRREREPSWIRERL